MAGLATHLQNSDRMITAARASDDGIEVVFADGKTGAIPFSEVPEIGNLSNLKSIDLPNPYELSLTNHQGAIVNLPWDFARYFCDPTYRPKIEAVAAAGRAALGQRIRHLRESSDMTQERLAVEAGISRITLVRIENAEQSPKYETLMAIAKALHRPVADLLLDHPVSDERVKTSNGDAESGPSHRHDKFEQRRKHEPIRDLTEGPWPGPVTRPIRQAEIRLDRVTLETARARVRKHKQGPMWYRTIELLVKPESVATKRWDYRGELSIMEEGEGLLRGVIVGARQTSQGAIHVDGRDGTYQLEHQKLGRIAGFGMEPKERAYWIVRLAGKGVADTPWFSPERDERPFMYAVPLIGLRAAPEGESIWFGDLGIAAGDMDNVFNPLARELELDSKDSVWAPNQPKACGVVWARDLIEAEQVALQRARFTSDLINLAASAGVSHWEDRQRRELLEWDRSNLEAHIRLSDWILIREVRSVKGWARTINSLAEQEPVGLQNLSSRVQLFLERFINTTQTRDIHAQMGRRSLSPLEKKIHIGIERSLRWHSLAQREPMILDKFLAEWVALEAIVDTVDYPKVFKGTRQEVQKYIIQCIDQCKLLRDQVGQQGLFSISADMLKDRLSNNDWSLPRKVRLFATAYGLEITPDDISFIQGLGKQRGQVLHAGAFEIGVTKEEVRRLAYFVERLIICASIGAYKELEREHSTVLHWGSPPDEGGGAPLYINGREVSYRFFVQQDSEGNQRWEVIAEGKVYDETNSEFARLGSS